MPAVKCLSCGRITNTAVADWLDCKQNYQDNKTSPEFADRCFAAVDSKNNVWVKGCAYDDDDNYKMSFVN